MIVVRVKGGLGNQMFQYAAGLRLARARQVELKLDLSYYERPPDGSTPRKFELGRLNISAPVANPEERRRFTRDLAGGRAKVREDGEPSRELPRRIRHKPSDSRRWG